MKEYTVSDLFFTKWQDLKPKAHAIAYACHSAARATNAAKPEYGHLLINTLRPLRKRPLLVDKINVEQAIDIYNDLKFLNEPWYYFPAIGTLKHFIPPAEKMARHTFDHFIYSDNEYSLYIVTGDALYLRRLLVTLYQMPCDTYFDKECVEEREAAIRGKVKDWQLNLVFFTYAQIREFVMKRCRTLMPKPIVSAEEEVKPTPTGPMWLKLKHRLSETPAYPGMEKAARANMYEALDYLEDLAQIKERNAKP